MYSLYYGSCCEQLGCQDKFYEMRSPHNHHDGKHSLISSETGLWLAVTPVCCRGETIDCFPTFFNSGAARFIRRIAFIISSYRGGATGHLAPGSVPISCHIISCFVRVTLALNRDAAPAAAVIRKMFISKLCFFNGTSPSLLN